MLFLGADNGVGWGSLVGLLDDVAKNGCERWGPGSRSYLRSHMDVRPSSSLLLPTQAASKSEIFGCKEQKYNSD